LPADGVVRLDLKLAIGNEGAVEAEPLRTVQSTTANEDRAAVTREDVPEDFLAGPWTAELSIAWSVEASVICAETGVDRSAPGP
jgi:hypothetical protein